MIDDALYQVTPLMNHVFVDFENVQKIDYSLIGVRGVRVTLMVGAQQKKLDTELAKKFLEHPDSVKMVNLSSSEKDALDIALGYYLGQTILEDPDAYFHIVAIDKGYDPLVAHLKEKKIKVGRHKSCAHLPFDWPGKAPKQEPEAKKKATTQKAAAKKTTKKKAAAIKAVVKEVPKKKTAKKGRSLEEMVAKVDKDLKNHPNNRPGKETKLRTKIGNIIGKLADDPVVQIIINALMKEKHLSFDENGSPVYHYPA